MAWHKVLESDSLPEGRVTTVSVGKRSIALSHHEGAYGAVDNRCPHQGGPLGEGSIEPGVEGKSWLRCPWHGYDYSPLTGESPGVHGDAPPCFAVEQRADGVYVEVPPDKPRERTVSDVLVETMNAWGVSAVFGMVGHSNLGFADAMREAEERGDMRYFGIRHEGAGAFAASAFGKLTGRPGACFAIAGPGSTNMLTGLYDARVDRSPIIALTGQVPSKEKGRGAFQDLDLEAAFADVAEYSESVHATSDAAGLMALACKTAIVGATVGHINLPDEVQVQPSDTKPAPMVGRVGSRLVAPPTEELAEAVEMMKRAKRPLFVVGTGARAGMDQVVALAAHIGAPVVTTFKAKGQISDHHPLGCGVLGRSGTPIASWFMNESDLICVFGASFSNHTGIATYKPVIQVDHDPLMLGRFDSVDVALMGDVGVTAQRMATAIGSDHDCHDHTDEVAKRWQIWREEKRSRAGDDDHNGLNAALVFDQLSERIDPNAVVTVDVGNNAYSLGRYFESKDQTFLMSGYLGSIGFAFPAAMGAWAAVGGERQVVSISGDGGFGQYAMELTTAVKYNMGITHVLLNNDELGKISKEQRGGHFDVWQTSLHNPDFAAFAELCGAQGHRVEDASQLDGALRSALNHDGPSLVEIITDVFLN